MVIQQRYENVSVLRLNHLSSLLFSGATGTTSWTEVAVRDLQGGGREFEQRREEGGRGFT